MSPRRSGRRSWPPRVRRRAKGCRLRTSPASASPTSETTVLWHRKTGQPLHRAIVWQDRRTEPFCAGAARQPRSGDIRARTGLVIDPYSRAPSCAGCWTTCLARGAGRSRRAHSSAPSTPGCWRLTGGRVHATDVSNASRTMLFNLEAGDWDDTLLQLNIPRSLLPAVHPSCHRFARRMRRCWRFCPSTASRATSRRPCSARPLRGRPYQEHLWHRLLHADAPGAGAALSPRPARRHAPRRSGPQAQFALEGAVFIGGAVVQWLRDGLHAVRSSSEVEALAAKVPDSGGVMFVPAHGPRRALLGRRGARRHRGPHARLHHRPHRPRGGGGDCLPERALLQAMSVEGGPWPSCAWTAAPASTTR